MKSNATKRIAGVMLALSLLCYTTLPVFAAGTAIEKEEVVYVRLSHDGRVNSVYVVNGFDLPQDGMITDAGHYSEIRNLTTTDAIRYGNDIVSVSAPQGKFYYEGVLASREIPWVISVEYLLDGRPISGDRLAGESGRLQIDLHIHHNPGANPVYTDNYAIQASLSLDGELCTNIEAENATIASVGQNKQLSYIILPGKEGDFTITADVVDFAMDGISINGIPLALNIDDPDTEEIKDKITELQDGAIELDDGAWELDDGAQELRDGATTLDEGATKLDDGVLSLEDGLAELDDGVEELQEGADDLRDGAHELYNGTKDLRDGVTDLEDGVLKLDSGAYTFGQGLSLLNGQSSALAEGSSAIRRGFQRINDSLAAVNGDALDTVAEQAEALANGSDQYLASLDAMIAEYEAQLSMLRNSSNTGSTRSVVKSEIRIGQEDSASYGKGQKADYNNRPDEKTMDPNDEEVADKTDEEKSDEDAARYDSETAGAYSDVVTTPYSLGASGLSANAEMVDFLEATIQNLRIMRQRYLEIHAGIEGVESFAIGIGRTLPGISAGIGEMTQQYEVLDQAVGAYTQGVTVLHGTYSSMTAGISALVDGVEKLMDGVKELRSGARELYDGTYDLQDGVSRLTDGAAELRDGATELRDGTIDMKDGTLELLDGVQELLDGTLELLDGTTELREKTADMDQEIDDKIDEMLEDYRGSDFDAVSFVDARNTVNSVQFVMLTEGISVDDAAQAPAVEAESSPLTLWQRFLKLFSFL